MVTRTPERAKDGIAQVRELMAIARGDAKHAEAAESTADALWVLYDRVLRETVLRSFYDYQPALSPRQTRPAGNGSSPSPPARPPWPP
ncbi:MAG: hypothetical protein ACRDNZ_14535, partial [Streptosporangiaceae bacterium]